MATMTQSIDQTPADTTLTHRWGWLLALGVVQIIAGTIAIAVPVIASLVAVAMFGAVLMVVAIFQLIHAFKAGTWRRSIWYAISGLLYAIAGIFVIAYPLGGAMTLAVLIAILFIADGAVRLAFAMSANAAVGRGWLIASAVCAILVGVFLLIGWPFTAIWFIGLLLGINVIFTGAMNIMIALASRVGAPTAARRAAV
jgi:uncharacterized membrane protein HdeD (DUF308 family)